MEDCNKSTQVCAVPRWSDLQLAQLQAHFDDHCAVQEHHWKELQEWRAAVDKTLQCLTREKAERQQSLKNLKLFGTLLVGLSSILVALQAIHWIK